MTKSFIAIGFFAACMGSALAGQIEHSGWNDLNKNGKKDPYEDPAQPIAKRVADLLKRMSIEEKIGQLQQAHRQKDTETRCGDQLRRGLIGSFLDGTALIETPGPRNRVQRIAVEESRLGIPLLFGHDSIHGFRTIFPIPLAQACAWEPELFERTQAISARETAAVGIDWTFAPMVDLARDPRWGRIAEGFGEDPWLGALDAAACVRGFQGTNAGGRDQVLACLKHYVGYGAAEGGRDYNTTEISEYTLRNFYLPQFQAGVRAGAWTVMSAFNCLSGFPASANRRTLTDILRQQWKFPGFVVSDWESVQELVPHGVAANPAQAARLALTAGVDMEMVSTTYHDTLKQQIEQKKIPLAELDEAVRRVLTVKFARGLFERPYVDEERYRAAFLREDALNLAREAAAKSCVLLVNKKGALPLSKQLKSIALIGPLADDAGQLLGCWSARGRAEDAVSLASGIRTQLTLNAQSRSPETRLMVAQGCGLLEHTNDAMQIEKAVEAAKSADVVIMALGEPRTWSGESASRSDLGLTGRQSDLFDAVAATGKPVIVVLFNGRPLAIWRIAERASAILEAWHPGIQGGNAVAEVLFGDADPSGRLTATFPYVVGQVPIHYNHFNTGRPGVGELKGNYVDGPTLPLYPFGFGLSYASFDYGKVELSASKMRLDGNLTASAQLTNTGARAGTEVVQLYLRDLSASAGPRPVRELKGFQNIRLNPGESRKIAFSISGRELGYYDKNGDWLVEPGHYEVWIAPDSASGKPADFEAAAGK